MNQVNILHDGSEIPERYKECLLSLTNDDNKIIMKYGNKPIINFVGLLEISYEDKEYRFFSFPKSYIVTDIKQDIIKVIFSIETAYKDNSVDDNSFYISQFSALVNIINYYYEYGLYVEREKIQHVKTSGKIKIKKTITKITPINNNGNFVYDKFIINKQQTYHTIISECMAYVIEIGSIKYDFYFNSINTNYFYDKNKFSNINYLINQLNKIRINIFKDEEKKLVDNIIAYFKNSSLSSRYVSQICTTNYELVYEQMIHNALSHIKFSNFEKRNFYMSEAKSGTYFTPDHLDIKNKIIADSKYYTNEITNDYKQLFYLQHIANKYATSENYIDRVKEINQWVNLLITPLIYNDTIRIYEHKQIINRKTIDGLNLYTLAININELINDSYKDGNNVSKKINRVIKEIQKLNQFL